MISQTGVSLYFDKWVRKLKACVVTAILSFLLLAEAFAQAVNPPQFAPRSAYSVHPMIVDITCATPGAAIYYTIDGSDPGPTQPAFGIPLPASGYIVVGNNSTIIARAYLGGNVSASSAETYRLAGGSVQGWGSPASGRLGWSSTPGTAYKYTTAVVPLKNTGVAFSNVADMAAGSTHSLIVENLSSIGIGGQVWAFGDNVYGQLGDNTVVDQPLGRRVLKTTVAYASATEANGDFLNDCVAVTGKLAASAALERLDPDNGFTGRVFTWGQPNLGRLGNNVTTGTVPRKYAAPVLTTPTPPLSGIVQIVSGENFFLALGDLDATGKGKIYAWGENVSGQLGYNNVTNQGLAHPVKDAAGVDITDFVDVAAGYDHGVGIRRTANGNQVYCWGQQNYGRLGNGVTTPAAAKSTAVGPVLVGPGQPLFGVIQVAAGACHSLALTSSGTVYAWGYNGDYNLGDGTAVSKGYATQVAFPGGHWIYVAPDNIYFPGGADVPDRASVRPRARKEVHRGRPWFQSQRAGTAVLLP